MRTPATERILSLFNELNQIPRCSKNEAGVCSWLKEFATKSGFEYSEDATGNLIVRVPASAGFENAPIIVLQGHMDMVCEKTDDSTHDFTKDPIISVEKDDWLYGDNTTLGADDGIAIAMALAAATDPSVQHPRLELLFTVSEEIGLWGVQDLQKDFVKGRVLINIDSEQEGTFTVGSAGGVTTEITIPMERQELMFDRTLAVQVSGCRGGHSGVDVHKHFANAIKLLARSLKQINKVAELQICDLKGGTAHNAIPRSAQAVIRVMDKDKAKIGEILTKCLRDYHIEHKGVDPEIKIELTEAKAADGLTLRSTKTLVDVLNAYPHGINDMSANIDGFVETSSNLASVIFKDANTLFITTSQRSVSMSKLYMLTDQIFAITELAGGTAVNESQYVSWEPDMDSKLLAVSKEAYVGLFGKEPIVEMIHAGLECSVIGDIYPGMDILSIGVTIENPHSPTERMYIPSIPKVWDLLAATLLAYKA